MLPGYPTPGWATTQVYPAREAPRLATGRKLFYFLYLRFIKERLYIEP